MWSLFLVLVRRTEVHQTPGLTVQHSHWITSWTPNNQTFLGGAVWENTNVLVRGFVLSLESPLVKTLENVWMNTMTTHSRRPSAGLPYTGGCVHNVSKMRKMQKRKKTNKCIRMKKQCQDTNEEVNQTCLIFTELCLKDLKAWILFILYSSQRLRSIDGVLPKQW